MVKKNGFTINKLISILESIVIPELKAFSNNLRGIIEL
jgi:hypothetical protein